jgi:DNA replication protein DnaC
MTAVTAGQDAAAYQRLRGHLAYLKLNAAIEALPALLDEARDGHLTVLDALEQLTGAEADAAQARKLASRLHWAALPAPWRLELSGVHFRPSVTSASVAWTAVFARRRVVIQGPTLTSVTSA